MKSFDPKQFTVLIVDDNPKNLQILGSMLTEEGYEVEFASNGLIALEWIDERSFDLVLLDVMMPGIDGFEVCKKIRKQEHLDNLPVLFLTAKTDKESTVKGFKLGAQDYIAKPFDTGELLARVKTNIELKKSRELLRDANQWLEGEVAKRTGELELKTKELEKANSDLRSLDIAKTDFLKIISHEIRTPLNGILGFLELLKTRIDSDELRSFIEMLDENAVRLESFSLTALHITNLTLRKQKVKKVPAMMNQMVADSMKHVKNRLVKKGIEMEYTDTSTQPWALDPELITFSLANILDNSIRHSDPGSTIKIHIESNEKENICRISDQGAGFSEEALENLYKMFSPGEQHIDSNKGLNLSLIKLIMDAHKGEIDVRNNEDKGATVTLIFPRS